MKLIFRIFPILLVLIPVLAQAQTGIGTISPDPDKALHVFARPGQQPVRLEGLNDDATDLLSNVVVTDANGVLYYRPIADLTISGEWIDHATLPYIFANQAEDAGNDVVVTDAGSFGIGTVDPLAPLHISVGGDLVNAVGGGAFRVGDASGYIGMDGNEIQTFIGTTPSTLNLNTVGAPVVIGLQSGNTSFLEVYGRARIGNLPAGDVNETAPDDEIVTADAAGNLRSVPLSDLNTGEWRNHSSDNYVFAKRADDAGNDVVVSDDGRIGVGIVAPRNALDIRDGGLVIENTGTNMTGVYDPREILRLTGFTDAVQTINDGSGHFNTKFNASYGSGNFLTSGRQAFQTRVDAVTAGTSVAYYLRQSTGTGTSGNAITWRNDFRMYGDGRANFTNDLAIGGSFLPTARLDVNGTARVRSLPTGLVSDDPLNTDDLVTADVNGNLRSVRPDIFFRDVGEWVNSSNSNYIYARRALSETGNNVVISRDGNMGLGRTNPTSKIHLRNGGIRIDGLDHGIGFNGENPYPADPINDGFRMYHENGSFGSWRDAFIFEKTDVNNSTVDGGIAFANRQAGDNRVISMVIRGDGEVGIGDNHVNPTERLHVIGRGLFQQGGTGTSADEGMIMLVDDRDSERPNWANRGLQVADNNEYAYFGMEDRNVGHDALLMWGDGTAQDLHFMHDNGGTQREVMMLDGQRLNVGIGTIPVADANVKLHVGGRTRIDDLDPQGAFDEANDLIVIADANGNLQTVTSAVFKQDFEDLDWVINGAEIYNANTGAVGIGLTNPNNASALHIDGDLRMENSSAIELDDGDVRIFAPNDGALDIEASSLTTFQNRTVGNIDPLVVDHANGRVSIGIGRAGNALSATVDGVLQMQDDSEIQLGSSSNNMMYAHSVNDVRFSANQLWSIRNRGDGTGILSVRTDQRRVGIGRNNPEDALDVDGRMRLRNVPVANSYDQFLVVNPADGTVRRRELDNFEGPWDRTVSGAEGRTVLRDINDVVGIGTTTPSTSVSLHIVEQNGTVAQVSRGTIMLDHEDAGGSSSIVFRSGSNRSSDYGYINYYDDNPDLGGTGTERSLLEIGNQNDVSIPANRDDIALMPAGRLGIKTRLPSRAVDINGDLRVRSVANSASDLYALTTDANGNVNRQDISAIKDNLGNHIATQNITLGSNVISPSGANNTGIAITPNNHTLLSNRLQLGNHSTTWINDPIPGTSEGFVGNDAAFFVPVRTGSENADLRLYIQDNNNDQFSIWGNACASADCGSVAGSTPVVKFFAGGDVDVTRLAHGGGTPLLVTADASGTLILGPDPATLTGGGGAADNLGNHTATTNIRIGGNAVTRTGAGAEGFRINTDGNIVYNDGRALLWGSTYGTAISGDVDANGDGTGRDLRMEADDDFYVLTTGNNADFIVASQGDVEMRTNNYQRYYTGTDNTNDDFRFFTDNSVERLRIANNGVVRVQNLGGGGNQVVGVNNDGDLFALSTSSDGLWDRDAANAETYLFNNGDDVGIGTANPDAALHVYRNSNTVESELRLQNQNGGGDSRIRFMEGTNASAANGFSFRYDGGLNDLFLERNDGRQYMTFEDGNGNVGVGAENPQVMLHVMRRAGSSATGGSDAQSGYNNPARIRISNEAGNGSAALEFSEGGAGIGGNSGMSVRYQGDLNEFHVMRGNSEDQNLNDIHLRIARNNGQTTIRHLGTTVTPGGTEMVIADDNGVLTTRAFDDNIWGKDDTDSEVFLDPAISGYQVGIGTAAPQRKLHVSGDVRIENFGTGVSTDDIVTVDANGDLRVRPASAFENYWTRDVSGNLYPATSADNIGIGESSPSAKLHVDGDVIITTMTAGLVGTDEIVVVDAAGLLKSIPANSFDSFWERNTAGAQDYIELSTATDFVGLGVIGAPTAQLHSTGDVRFESLANVSGDEVVVADASGVLSTRALPTQLWDRDVANGYTFNSFSSDNVGIGTSTPSTKLHVASGQVTITDINSVTGDEDTDRVVVADGSGALRTLPIGTLESYWTYESATNELYPKDLTAKVGIGTNNPRSDMHLYGTSATASVGDPVELQIQNRRNGGTAAIRFRDNGWTGANADNYNSVSLRWVGATNMFEIANGSDSTLFRIRRQNGYTAIGYNLPTGFNPPEQLWVQGDIGVEDGGDIQFAEANSYLRDNGNDAGATTNDSDVVLSAAEDLLLRADAGINIRATGGNLDMRSSNIIDFRTGANDLQARISTLGRFEVYNNTDAWDIVNRGATYLTGAVRVIPLAGGGTQMVVADNNGTLGQQAIPVDTDDQGLILTGNTITIEDGTGSINLAPYLDNTDAQDLTYDPSTGIFSLTNDGTSVDLSSSTIIDDQDLVLTGSILSLTNDASTVDLSAFANTDAQALGITGDDLTITGNASTVDLSGYLDNTDAQALGITGDNLTITGNATVVDLSGYLDNTDAQDLTLTGSTLSLSNDASTVDLSAFANTDAQDLSLSANTLSLTNDGTAVDLSGYLDNTDAQALGITGDDLTITGNAAVVDLSGYLDNTDAQALSYDAATGILSLVDGGTVNLASSTIIDDQTLSLSGSELTIANGNMVDLAAIGGWSRTGTEVTLSTATDNVGIGTAPDAGVRFQVDGQVRFNALSGGAFEIVMANSNGDLTKRTAGQATGWTRSAGNMALFNTGDNLMVGIGTASAKLHVNGSTQLDGTLTVGGVATFEDDVEIGSATTGKQLTITGDGTDSPLRLVDVQAAAAGPHDVLVLNASGEVEVVNGVTASDRRLKENVAPMEGTLEKLLGMESVSFNYRQDVKDYPYSLDEATHYGVIAQQVQIAFPHAVVEKDGYLHIQEKELMGVVISATKELSAKNTDLEAANEELKAANEHLAEQVYHMMMDKADLEKTVHSLEAQTSELQVSMDVVLQHIANGKQVQAGGN
ncbi:MAG: tail fiber domain-containing protein [Saprospiraceae bacterium]